MTPVLPLLIALANAPMSGPLVVPGESLGGIKLGTAEADLEKIGMPVKPGNIETWRKVGPFEVQIEGGKVVQISLDLSPEMPHVRIGADLVTPTSPEDMAARMEGCGPLSIRIGGNMIECTSGAMAGQHMGGLTIRVVPPSKASDQPVCAAYLVPGTDGVKVNLEPGKTYCASDRLLTTEIVQADVLGKLSYNTCKTQPNEGATVVTCPFHGVRFVFAAPSGKLARIEGVPIKK